MHPFMKIALANLFVPPAGHVLYAVVMPRWEGS